MLGGIFRVIMDTPFLMVIFLVNVGLIIAIVAYVARKLYEKKRPDMSLKNFWSRFKLKNKKSSARTLEGLYDLVIRTYVRRGTISRDLGKGFKAREAILSKAKDKEKTVVANIFNGYEMKTYGGGVSNEKQVVEELFNRFRAL